MSRSNSTIVLGSLFVLMTMGAISFAAPRIQYSDGPQFDYQLYAPVKTTSELALAEYSIVVMDHCKVKHSAARKRILADQIGRIVGQQFQDRQHAQAFIALMCIESRFDDGAQSPVGAVGISQLMPQYAQNFADICSIGKVERRDLDNTEVNMRLGACFFKSLLVKFDGNVALALSAYNSGAASKTTAQLGQLGSSNPETAGYLARHYVLTQKAEKQ